MKVVYDTCLYIDFLRSSKQLDLFLDRSKIRYLSPVVMMELMAGVRTPRQKKIIDRLVKPYSKAFRMIPMRTQLYYKAGTCLAKMCQAGLIPHRGFANDILIALSAASVGAVLFTSNKKDFERIRKFVPLEIQFV